VAEKHKAKDQQGDRGERRPDDVNTADPAMEIG
jgi:hypothetical protein